MSDETKHIVLVMVIFLGGILSGIVLGNRHAQIQYAKVLDKIIEEKIEMCTLNITLAWN